MTEGLLRGCGFEVNAREGRVTCFDVQRCYRSLESELRRQQLNIDRIRRDMIEFLSDPLVLAACLSPLVSTADSQSEQLLPNDSCFKIMLRVQTIQSPLLQLLLDHIVAASPISNGLSPKIACMLNHIRWIDTVYSSTDFLRSLFRVLPVLAIAVQIEFITALPRLCHDSDGDLVVEQLLERAAFSSELIPAAFEAVSSLDLTAAPRALTAALDQALEMLSTAEPPFLPTLTRFILETVPLSSATKALGDVRMRLSEFITVSKDESGEERKASLSAETLIVGIVKMAFQARPTLLQSFTKAVEASLEVTVLDLWVTYILTGSARLKTKAFSLLGKLLHGPGVTKTVVQQSLRKCGVPLESVFSSALELARTCINSKRLMPSGSGVRDLGALLFTELYKEFSSGSKRQDVVAALVNAAGSPTASEVDTALSILHEICKWDAQQLRNREVSFRAFLPFVKSLLDDLGRLSDDQNRVLFTILFRASSSQGSATAAREHDDVLILLRKMCVSTDAKRRRVAVIGTIAYVMHSDDQDWGPDSECQRCLQHILRQTRDDSATRVFFLDEAYRSIVTCQCQGGAVSHAFLATLSELCGYYVNSFVSSRVIDAPTGRDLHTVRCEKRFALSDAETRHLRLYSGAVESSSSSSSSSASSTPHIEMLAPAFKVLLVADRLLGKDAEDVLSLVPLSLELPVDDCLDRCEDFTASVRHAMCVSLKAAIDWVRECTNIACCGEVSVERRTQLVLRFNLMLELEAILLYLVQRSPTFVAAMVPPALGKSAKRKDKKPASSEADPKELEDWIQNRYLRTSSSEVAVLLGYAAEDIVPSDDVRFPFQSLNIKATLRLLSHLQAACNEYGSSSSSSSSSARDRFLVNRPAFASLFPLLRWVSEVLVQSDDIVLHADNDPDETFPVLLLVSGLIASLCKCKELVDVARKWCSKPSSRSAEVPVLLSILASMRGASLQETSDLSPSTAIEISFLGVFEELKGIASRLHSVEALDCAVSCVATLDELLQVAETCTHASDKDLRALLSEQSSEMSSLCDDMLRREWKDSINKRKYSQRDVSVLVRLSILRAAQPITRIEVLVDNVLPELRETDDCQGPVPGYPTLSASTFVLYFATILQCISTCWKKTLEEHTRLGIDSDTAVSRMKCLVQSFSGLISLTRAHEELEKKSILVTALREGRKFIELFVGPSMKTLSALFAEFQIVIMGFVATLQKATRQLQAICSHAKFLRNPSLAAEAPAIKRALEEFIFKIKELLSSTNSSHVAKVGFLSRKRLDGSRIPAGEEEQEYEQEAPRPQAKKSRKTGKSTYKTDQSRVSPKAPSTEESRGPKAKSRKRRIEVSDDEGGAEEALAEEVDEGLESGLIASGKDESDKPDDEGEDEDDFVQLSEEESDDAGTVKDEDEDGEEEEVEISRISRAQTSASKTLLDDEDAFEYSQQSDKENEFNC